jgi:hypothetical protein
LKQREKAIDDYSKAIGLDPKDPRPLIHRYLLYEKLGNPDLIQKDRQNLQRMGVNPD